jgi:polysaccharide chain length determinant protein (PEP-CTERM system associated)
MNDLIDTLHEILFGVWRRRWIMLAVSFPLAVAGGVVAALVPERYEASAKVFVDTQTVLKPLMQDLTFQPDIDQQVSMLAKTLISRPNVELLLSSQKGNFISPSPQAYDATVDKLLNAIKVDAIGKNLYQITDRDMKPERAKNVVQGLVEMFVDTGLGGKRRDSEEARRFIDEQIHQQAGKLAESENLLKDFKLRNFGMTGTSNQDFFARVSQLSDEVAKLRGDLSSAEQSRDALRRELSVEDPQLPPTTMGGAAAAAPSELDLRIDAQKKALDELLRRYTDEHPDVVSTRRTIAQLEKQRDVERSQVARQGRTVGTAATSPVYQKIRISLAEAEAKVAELRTQMSVQSARLEETRSKANKLPEVEAELAQLNRDYDVLRKNYEQMVSRRESATLGVKLDQSAQLADFRIVEPPRVSPKAVFPNRLSMAMLMVLASVAGGVAVAFGLGQLSPTFHTVKGLRSLTNRPVLGSVSLYVSDAQKAIEWRQNKIFLSVVGFFFLLNGGWVVWVATHAPRT